MQLMRTLIPVVQATNVRKSQGVTFGECAIGYSPKISRACVALPRIKSPNGLYVFNEFFPPKKPEENDRVMAALVRLKHDSIIPIFRFLGERSEPNRLHIMYHSVQSLKAHYEDILADPCFMNSDVLLFSETWTLPKDRLRFPNFMSPNEIYSDLKTRKPGGVSIYARNNVTRNTIEYEQHADYETGIHINFVHLEGYRIGVLYAKPGLEVMQIVRDIDDTYFDGRSGIGTILCGDFNIEMESEDGLYLRYMLYHLFHLIMWSNPRKFTTRGRTTMDAIFASKHLITCGVYENEFGYHLPMYATCG